MLEITDGNFYLKVVIYEQKKGHINFMGIKQKVFPF